MLALLSLLACAPDVIALYSLERESALTFVTDRPSDWQPDAKLRISKPALSTAIGAGLRAAVSGELPTVQVELPLGQSAKMRPHLVVDQASVVPSDSCSPCLDFDGNLLGKVEWSIASLNGSFPFELAASGVLAVEIRDGAKVMARLQTVRKVQVQVLRLGGFAVNPSSTLEKFAKSLLLDRLEPILLTELDISTLPFRDLRLSTSADGLTVDMLSNVPTGRPLPPLGAATADVELALSESTLLALARRAAFTQGELAMDVVADPRILMVNEDSFTMGLRLWRLVGRGWWRDYTVLGKIVIEKGNIKFKPEKVTEGAKSPGAGLVDPLAALFEGTILNTVEKGLRQSMPASRTQDLGGGVRLSSEVSGVRGQNGAVLVQGTIAVLQGVVEPKAPSSAPAPGGGSLRH